MFKKILLLIFIAFSSVLKSQDSTLVYKSMLNSYLDVYSNLNGGIKEGVIYRDLLIFSNQINYLNKYEFISSFSYAGGRSPSECLIGDLQTVSNIDADIRYFLYEMYIKINLNCGNLKIGVQNLNEDFVSCENSLQLINSSFGIPSLITYNSFSSVYPKTTLGIVYLNDIRNVIKYKVALFDGFPDDISKNELSFGVHPRGGLISLFEIENVFRNNSLKLGTFFHTGSLTKRDTDYNVSSNKFLYGIWCSRLPNTINYFLTMGHSLNIKLQHDYFIAFGLNYIFTNKKNEKSLTIGFSHAGEKRFEVKSESALEITYKYSLNHLSIQPDIQYIINPGGMKSSLKNALMFNVRLNIVFNN
ncbi:MAG TPA: carbohydrate porin [Bacteroidales bacterium]|nr:carbohydrate porin [Bacteroidales bacterium]